MRDILLDIIFLTDGETGNLDNHKNLSQVPDLSLITNETKAYGCTYSQKLSELVALSLRHSPIG